MQFHHAMKKDPPKFCKEASNKGHRPIFSRLVHEHLLLMTCVLQFIFQYLIILIANFQSPHLTLTYILNKYHWIYVILHLSENKAIRTPFSPSPQMLWAHTLTKTVTKRTATTVNFHGIWLVAPTNIFFQKLRDCLSVRVPP